MTTLAALDSTRLRNELAKHFNIHPDKVENCRTYGGHGEQMAVFSSTAKVDGNTNKLDIKATFDIYDKVIHDGHTEYVYLNKTVVLLPYSGDNKFIAIGVIEE